MRAGRQERDTFGLSCPACLPGLRLLRVASSPVVGGKVRRWAGWRGPLLPMTLPSRAPSTFPPVPTQQLVQTRFRIHTRETTPDGQLLCCRLLVTASKQSAAIIKAGTSQSQSLSHPMSSLVPPSPLTDHQSRIHPSRQLSRLRTEMLHSRLYSIWPLPLEFSCLCR